MTFQQRGPLFRRGARSRSRRRPRRLEWVGFTTATAEIDVAPFTWNVLIANDVIKTWVSPTLMRIRGEFLVRMFQPEATVADGVLFMGIQLQSVAITPALLDAAESPNSEISSRRWLWFHSTPFFNGGATGGVTSDLISGFSRFELDAKSRRKIGETDQLVLAASYAGGGTTTARIQVAGRALVMQS